MPDSPRLQCGPSYCAMRSSCWICASSLNSRVEKNDVQYLGQTSVLDSFEEITSMFVPRRKRADGIKRLRGGAMLTNQLDFRRGQSSSVSWMESRRHAVLPRVASLWEIVGEEGDISCPHYANKEPSDREYVILRAYVHSSLSILR